MLQVMSLVLTRTSLTKISIHHWSITHVVFTFNSALTQESQCFFTAKHVYQNQGQLNLIIIKIVSKFAINMTLVLGLFLKHWNP